MTMIFYILAFIAFSFQAFAEEIPHDDDIIVVTDDNEVRTLPSFGPGFKISYELMIICFADVDNTNITSNSSNILTFEDSNGTSILEQNLLFEEKKLQLKFGDIVSESPSGVFTTKEWYQFVITQEETDGKYNFSVTVNGRQLVILESSAKTFEDVKILAGKGPDAANALLRNFEVINENTADIKVGRNQLLNTLRSWGPSWNVSFHLKINNFPYVQTESILQFTTNKNYDCCSSGYRVPAIIIDRYRTLYIYNQIGSSGSSGYAIYNLERGQFYDFEISQFQEENEQYYFSIKINGDEKYKINQSSPRTYSNVFVFAGLNTYRYNAGVSDSILRNLQYHSGH